MPQLDIYNFSTLNLSIIFVSIILYNLNIYVVLLNIFFWLNIIQLKNFAEKQFISKVLYELLTQCDLTFLKKNLLWFFSYLKDIILNLIILLDIYSYNIKLFYFIFISNKIVFDYNIDCKNNFELNRHIV